jgi:hypothetical protein
LQQGGSNLAALFAPLAMGTAASNAGTHASNALPGVQANFAGLSNALPATYATACNFAGLSNLVPATYATQAGLAALSNGLPALYATACNFAGLSNLVPATYATQAGLAALSNSLPARYATACNFVGLSNLVPATYATQAGLAALSNGLPALYATACNFVGLSNLVPATYATQAGLNGVSASQAAFSNHVNATYRRLATAVPWTDISGGPAFTVSASTAVLGGSSNINVGGAVIANILTAPTIRQNGLDLQTLYAPVAQATFASNCAAFGSNALPGKAAASHTHDWTGITGKPATFAPSAHTHGWLDGVGHVWVYGQVLGGDTHALTFSSDGNVVESHDPIFANSPPSILSTSASTRLAANAVYIATVKVMIPWNTGYNKAMIVTGNANAGADLVERFPAPLAMNSNVSIGSNINYGAPVATGSTITVVGMRTANVAPNNKVVVSIPVPYYTGGPYIGNENYNISFFRVG